ncbi:HutD family protein [Undibacterium sp. RuRC25W]|uniref:HutD/Ves family protein n=1 Tax=Undibacterium sp. RuRC25W TaxID=3413047 RepID=UPI003BF028AB
MRKWTQQDYHTMPWKNGGGSTTELAIFPVDAHLENFVWRLSTAAVNADGPFSHFSQIDRTLAILSGEGLILHTDDGAQAPQANVSLTRSVAPYRFAGELPINAELIADPVLDLNMMTRRDVCQHHMQRLSAGDHFVSAGDSQQVLLYCAQGSATLSSGESLVQGDLCLFEERHEHEGVIVGLSAADDAQLYLITIHFLNMGQS